MVLFILKGMVYTEEIREALEAWLEAWDYLETAEREEWGEYRENPLTLTLIRFFIAGRESMADGDSYRFSTDKARKLWPMYEDAILDIIAKG